MGPTQSYRVSRCNSVYLCSIAADGTFVTGPLDWDALKTGVGIYKITHNFGHLQYAVVSSPLNAADYKPAASIQSKTQNDVTVNTWNAGTAADGQFQLLVITTQ